MLWICLVPNTDVTQQVLYIVQNRSVPQSLFTTTPFHNPIDNQLNMSFPIIRGNETRVSSCEGIVNYTFTDKNHLLQALNNACQGPSPSIQQLRQHVRQKRQYGRVW
jgi:hypothetical protein